MLPLQHHAGHSSYSHALQEQLVSSLHGKTERTSSSRNDAQLINICLFLYASILLAEIDAFDKFSALFKGYECSQYLHTVAVCIGMIETEQMMNYSE